MCTAITYQTKDLYFGRTLDDTRSYGETITVMPRGYPLVFRHTQAPGKHYAMIGMAHVESNYPLYYDAVNEKGLCMAGLQFSGSASYPEYCGHRQSVASFELIPWVLGYCASVKEARARLSQAQPVNTAFSPALPATPLHWLIADKAESAALEITASGIQLHDDPVGVLTNDPPLPIQLFLLGLYRGLSPHQPENRFAAGLSLPAYSRGMGALGLPGDLSSASRFVRAAFTKLNAQPAENDAASIGQFFHILETVSQVKGCCAVENAFEYTRYTACCNATQGVYYYTTYENRQISAVSLHAEDLSGASLHCYPLQTAEQIYHQNAAPAGG